MATMQQNPNLSSKDALRQRISTLLGLKLISHREASIYICVKGNRLGMLGLSKDEMKPGRIAQTMEKVEKALGHFT